jgi:ribonuclease HI
MTIYAHCDGASRGNPGESGIGVILRDEEGNVIFSGGGYLGKGTNNVAEYEALIACLKKAATTGCTKLIVYSDSQLMVRQLQGLYKVKDKNLQKYFQQANRLIRSGQFAFEISHIEREQNRDADLLANAGIDSKRKLRI